MLLLALCIAKASYGIVNRSRAVAEEVRRVRRPRAQLAKGSILKYVYHI
jgi:hypothetical protein